MKFTSNNALTGIALSYFIANFSPAYGMGLRTFVALPVEKYGSVVRFAFEHNNQLNTDVLSTNVAYGLSTNETMLVSLPYRLSPGGMDQQGDLSILYRHVIWRRDSFSGTKRLGLLGGGIIPTVGERDAALQTGFVYTQFKDRHEVDVDLLYQAGIDKRPASGRYDFSWQYRLSPKEYSVWGIDPEYYLVMELNGRWEEEASVVHQATIGLQRTSQSMVLEVGIVQDLNTGKDWHYLLSTRIHF